MIVPPGHEYRNSGFRRPPVGIACESGVDSSLEINIGNVAIIVIHVDEPLRKQ